MRIALPMILIATLNTLNLWMELVRLSRLKEEETTVEAAKEERAAEDYDSAGRYLEISSVLALAAVFVLPNMARSRRPVIYTLVTWDEMYVLIVFLALVLSSFPPGLTHELIAIVGCGILWASFILLIQNAILYICLSVSYG